jgi:hypothetical protein
MASINLRECDNDAESGCRTSPNGNGNYRGGLSWYSNRNHCVKSIEDACRAELKQYQLDIANFKYTSNQYVITVIRKNNYEGNIICYVDLRTKGTDNVEHDKITFQRRNNAWLIVSFEDASKKK